MTADEIRKRARAADHAGSAMITKSRRDELHDEQGFSHHCPKCNHHNPAMCVMAGQVTGISKVVQILKDDINNAKRELDAKDARIAELTGALESTLEYAEIVGSQNDEVHKAATNYARAALAAKPNGGG